MAKAPVHGVVSGRVGQALTVAGAAGSPAHHALQDLAPLGVLGPLVPAIHRAAQPVPLGGVVLLELVVGAFLDHIDAIARARACAVQQERALARVEKSLEQVS